MNMLITELLSDHWAQGVQSGWDIKRLLGTVPVEEDGSAIFKIPANTPISSQLFYLGRMWPFSGCVSWADRYAWRNCFLV